MFPLARAVQNRPHRYYIGQMCVPPVVNFEWMRVLTLRARPETAIQPMVNSGHTVKFVRERRLRRKLYCQLLTAFGRELPAARANHNSPNRQSPRRNVRKDPFPAVTHRPGTNYD